MTAKLQTTRLTTTAWTLIYTAPASEESSVIIEATNATGADIDFELAWQQSDANPLNVTDADRILEPITIPNKNGYVRSRRKVPADVSLFAKTSVATINVHVSAVEG